MPDSSAIDPLTLLRSRSDLLFGRSVDLSINVVTSDCGSVAVRFRPIESHNGVRSIAIQQRSCRLTRFPWIKSRQHATATGLTHDTSKFGEGVWTAIAHASARATDRIACDDATLSVDLAVDEIVVIASISAIGDTAISALDRIVGRGVGDKPRLPAVIGCGDIQIPYAREIHVLVIRKR